MELTEKNIRAIQRLLWEEKSIVHHQVKSKGFCNVRKNLRFGTWVFSGSGSKNYLKQFLAYEPEYKCIAQILNCKGYRQFIPFKTWQECWDIYKTTGYEHRYINEVILSDNPCKPYLDIEWKYETIDEAELNTFIKRLIKDIKFAFKCRYNINLRDEHILITESHGSNKVSFHVVINCIINNTYYAYATNRKKYNNSAWDLYVALTEYNKSYEKVIDNSVYTLDREFRAIYSTKFGEHRHLIPYGSTSYRKFVSNYLDYFVTHFDNDIPIRIIKTPAYVHPKHNLIKRVNKLSEITGNHVKDYKVNYKYCDAEKDILDRIYELLQFVHPTAYFTNKTQDNNGWRFSYRDKSEVCYTGKVHQHNGFGVFINASTGNVYMYCYSARCGHLYKLGNLHYDSLWERESVRLSQRYLDYKTNIKSMGVFERENIRFSGLINTFIENGGCYVIKSNMGTGKTHLLKQILETKFKDDRILYLSHRQTFTQNVFGEMEMYGFCNYMNDLSSILDKDKIIIQIDSLKHLISDDNMVNAFDIIIMDEIESLLHHLSSHTLSERRTITCTLIEHFVKNAKWVLGMDADFNNRGYEFLCKLREKPRVIINEYITVRKMFLFNHQYEKRCNQILEDVKTRKNVVIISLSKTTIDDIYDIITSQLSNIKIIRYTSMTDDEQKELLIHVNDEWCKYQVVMYSPTIEAGVNFDKEHFNKMYCFLNNGSCSPRSFMQMTGRIRTISDCKIRCCYNKFMKFIDKKTYVPSIDEVEDMITSNYEMFNNVNLVKTLHGDHHVESNKNAFTRTFAHNYLENYEKMVRFLPQLKELIVKNGWEYLNEDAGEYDSDHDGDVVNNKNTDKNTDKNTKNVHMNNDINTSKTSHTEPSINVYEGIEKLTSCGTSRKTQELDELVEAPFITDSVASELLAKKKRNKATREEKISLEKYRIMHKFEIAPKDFTLEFLLNWRGKEYVLDNILYAIGKLKVNKENDTYLNKMEQRLKYAKQIINIFGFTQLYDFETSVVRDDAMEERLNKSGMLEWTTYRNVMACFERRIRMQDDDIDVNQQKNKKVNMRLFMLVAESILNDFGLGLIRRRRQMQINGARKWCYVYNIIPTRNGVKCIVDNSKTFICSNV
jgi:hypothetical protein